MATIIYNGNFEWSNGKTTATLTNEGYRGFNGKINEYAPGNTAELIGAIVSSSDDNDAVILALNTMFSMNPFFSMSTDTRGWHAYRQALAFLRATKDYKDSATERIVHVVLNKYNMLTAEERTVLIWYGEAISRLINEFDEADIIAFINDSEYDLCGALFERHTVQKYLNKKKLMQYLPPNTPQHLIDWGLSMLDKFPNYAQAIATMIRNGLAQTTMIRYNFSYGTYLHGLPGLFLTYAQRLNIENPNPNGNIINKINQMHLEYEARKEELAAARIAKTKEKLEYSAYGFCVVVPTTRAEYKAEADAQHNCLYNFNYFDDVVNGDTNIAFVRKEDDPETPFVTCQITNSGRIVQFYTKNNYDPKGDDINKFRNEWARHLRETFND